jgi:ketosteroid isomerase-like protein
MRTLAFSLFLAITVASAGPTQSGTQIQTNEKLENLLQEFETLLSKGDVERLGAWIDRYMVDDFSCVNTNGSLVSSKAQERASLIDLVSRAAKIGGRMETTEPKIRTFGDTAIFTGLTHMVVQKTPTDEKRETTFRRMNVWIRENGGWKWAACAGASVTSSTPSAPLKK